MSDAPLSPDRHLDSTTAPASPPRTFSAGDFIAGRFRIVSFLGEGGMAQVYEAEDVVLSGERVAIKTLPAILAGDERAIERLTHEIAIARRITHPNVCRVFDVYQHERASGGSITFFTMELLDGDTLAQRMRDRGPMTTAEALPIIEQMGAALGAAHAARIVHGDFKPGNVMLVRDQDGAERAVVTDFGLAHRASTTALSEPTTTTSHGWGTPAYMAPEQIERRGLTRAADIYAFGIIVHEMITGELPPRPDSRQPHSSLTGLDARWQAAVRRCLSRDPAARFRTPDELVRALAPPRRKWMWPAALAALVLLLLAVPFIRSRLVAPSAPRAVGSAIERSIGLIPFAVTPDTPESRAFSRGFVTVLGDQLRLATQMEHQNIQIVPAAEIIDAAVATPAAANRTLGIDLIVTGRFDRSNDRTRVTMSVDKASANGIAPVRRETFDVRTADELVVPAALTHLAQMLGRPLAAQAVRAAASGGSGLAAAEAPFLRGRGFLAGDDADLDTAIAALAQAIAVDRQFALAHAALSDAYRHKYRVTQDASFIQRAQASGDEAIRLDSAPAYSHAVRGLLYQTTGQHARAIDELKAALQADPGAVDARRGLAESYEAEGALAAAEDVYRRQIAQYSHYWVGYEEYGSFLFRHGRYPEAETNFLNGVRYAPDNVRAISNLAGLYILTERFAAAEGELRRAVSLEPDVLLYNNLAWVYVFEGRFADAVAPMQQAVALPGADSFHWGNLARIYRWANRRQESKAAYDEALRRAQEAMRVNPRSVLFRANLAYLWAETGHRADALAEIASALERAPTDTTVLFKSALVYELTGDRAGALHALEAAARGGHSMVEIRRHPDLARLREDPRFVPIPTKAKGSGVK